MARVPLVEGVGCGVAGRAGAEHRRLDDAAVERGQGRWAKVRLPCGEGQARLLRYGRPARSTWVRGAAAARPRSFSALGKSMPSGIGPSSDGRPVKISTLDYLNITSHFSVLFRARQPNNYQVNM